MTWISTATQWVGWFCAVTSLSVLTFTSPLQAEDPRTSATDSPTAVTAKVLQDYVDTRGLTVFRQAVADLNHDGATDIIAHVARPEPAEGGEVNDAASSANALVVVVAPTSDGSPARIAASVADGMLCPWCPIGSDDEVQSPPEQAHTAQDDGFEVCESWGKHWFARECSQVILDADMVLRVQKQSESSGWDSGPTEHSLEFDLKERMG